MQIEAIPTQFVVATDGHLHGREHVVLFLRPAGRTEAQGYALSLHDAKRAAGLPKPGNFDFHPFGVEACRPALTRIIQYAAQQKLIPKSFAVDDLFDDNTRKLGA